MTRGAFCKLAKFTTRIGGTFGGFIGGSMGLLMLSVSVIVTWSSGGVYVCIVSSSSSSSHKSIVSITFILIFQLIVIVSLAKCMTPIEHILHEFHIK